MPNQPNKVPYRNPENLIPMMSKAGVKRDGTTYDNMGFHTDSQWVRWQRGRARKMWGKKMISANYTYPSRGCFGYTKAGIYYLNSGGPSNLEIQQFDSTGAPNSFADRTPAGFTSSSDNVWQFDVMYDANTSSARVIAHAAPNLSNIDSSTQAPIYYGDAYGSGALTAIASSSVAGGVVAMYPYLFGLDADGGVIWSVANKPGDMTNAGSGSARVTGRKIVCGRTMRGGAGVNPAGIFWALDAMVRATFAGGTAIFNFDRITAKGYSILSSQCPVEYDGIHYWPGQDRFMSFNGVIQELPNNTHINFFYDNLNFAQRQKVRGTYNPHWGEIQWLAPLFGATECNWMLIYNVREQTWYDTPIDAIMGEHNEVFPYPILFDSTNSGTGKTQLWMHDYGRDSVNSGRTDAIRSYYTTEVFSSLTPTIQPVTGGEDVGLLIKRIVPDFKNQVGNLNITLTGRKYPQSTATLTKSYTSAPAQEKVDTEFQSKLFTVTVESNVAGGDFECGMPMMAVQKGQVHP